MFILFPPPYLIKKIIENRVIRTSKLKKEFSHNFFYPPLRRKGLEEQMESKFLQMNRCSQYAFAWCKSPEKINNATRPWWAHLTEPISFTYHALLWTGFVKATISPKIKKFRPLELIFVFYLTICGYFRCYSSSEGTPRGLAWLTVWRSANSCFLFLHSNDTSEILMKEN